MPTDLTVRTDGGARGNPGPAGIGVVIEADGRVIRMIKRSIGEATNNVAEYTAIITALEAAKALGARRVTCFLDSELVVRQLKGEYKVKNAGLGPLFLKAWNLAQQFERVEFRHVPREQNAAADRLVNEAIDEAIRRTR